jgi:hypothetical protein
MKKSFVLHLILFDFLSINNKTLNSKSIQRKKISEDFLSMVIVTILIELEPVKERQRGDNF